MQDTCGKALTFGEADTLLQLLRRLPDEAEREFTENGMSTQDLEALMVKLQEVRNDMCDY